MKLVDKLKKDFSQFLFAIGEVPHWAAAKNTIFYRKGDDIGLLHELGHALCGHVDFKQDVELLHAERDAWEKACEIAPKYGVKIDSETVETAMDGYRDWLHQRSTCPNCGQNGVQNHENSQYFCPNCETYWRANDARQTSLKRRKIK